MGHLPGSRKRSIAQRAPSARCQATKKAITALHARIRRVYLKAPRPEQPHWEEERLEKAINAVDDAGVKPLDAAAKYPPLVVMADDWDTLAATLRARCAELLAKE